MSESGAREYVSFVPALNVRSRIVAWCAVGLGFCSFLFLRGNQDAITSFGFSLCLTILGIVSFRWWTRPVHPGLFNYFSPHAIILLHFFVYFGPGNLLPLAFPEQIVITYGSQDYYLPTIMIAILGAVVFDFCYRFLCRWLKLNQSLEECVRSFYTPRIQASIAPTALVWFAVCTSIFLYMSRTYLMMTFRFVGVDQTIDTTYSTAGPALLGVAWGLGSLLLWRQQTKIGKILVTGLLVSLLPVYLAYQNRRLFLYSMLSTLMAYLFTRVSRFTPRKLLGAFAFMAAAFVLISMAKVTVTRADYSLGRYTQEEKDIFSRARRILSSPDFLKLQPLEGLLQHNARERMAGLDWPAAIMGAHLSRNIPFMEGEVNLASAAMAVPRLLWPNKPSVGIGTLVYTHYGLAAIDPLGTPLSAAYADGGVLGVVVGFPLLALLFVAGLKAITLRRDGIVIYVAALSMLMRFEDTLIRYPIRWLRWVAILLVVNALIRYTFEIYAYRKDKSGD